MPEDKKENSNPLLDEQAIKEVNEEIARQQVEEVEKKEEIVKETVEEVPLSDLETIAEEAKVTEVTNSDYNESDVAKATYGFLAERGILPEGKEVKSLDDFTSSIEEAVNVEVDRIIQAFPSDIKQAILLSTEGKAYKNVFQESEANAILETKEEDLNDNNELAKKYLTMLLESDGESPEYIKRRLALAESGDFLIEEGKRALKKFKATDSKRAELQKVKDEEQRKVAEDNTKAYYTTLDTLIENNKTVWSFNMSNKDKDKLKNLVSVPKTVDGQQILELQEAIQKDPSIWVQMNYLYMKGVLGKEGNTDLFVNKAKTDSTQELANIFGATTTTNTNLNSSFNPLDIVIKGLKGN